MDADGGRMKGVRVTVVVMVVLMLMIVGPPDRVLGQQLPCLKSPKKPGNCCSCPDGWLLCLTRCPARHTTTSDLGPGCLSLLTTTESPTLTANNTNNATTTALPTTTAPPPSQFVRCLPCHSSCQACNGTGPEDCLRCADDLEPRTYNRGNGATASLCVQKKPPSKVNAGGIAGGVVAVVVAVVVVVVAVVLVRRRRRMMNMQGDMPKRSISTLMGCGGGGASGAALSSSASPSPSPSVQGNARDTERGEGVVGAEKRSNVRTLKEATYANVQTTVPKTESIQQVHDNVLRYTRDPTVKGKEGQSQPSKTKQKPSRKETPEEAELAERPKAPIPGDQDSGLAPPEREYEITEFPFATKAPAKPGPKPGPKPAASPTSLQLPAKGYEVMEFPINTAATTRSSDTQVPRVGLLKTGSMDKRKRKTTAAASTLPSALPNPKAPVSCPNLAKFPSEQYVEKKAPRKQQTPERLSPHSYADLQPPEDDYENVGSKKGAPVREPAEPAEPEEPEEPEDDYVNAGPKKKLVPEPTVPEEPSSGVDNLAAELGEPQEVYGNVDETGRAVSTGASEEPTYGNEVSDEEEEEEDSAYQNCPPRRSQS
ncbi:hypothetical protein ACOMHN_017211 [Nucella lapillus]